MNIASLLDRFGLGPVGNAFVVSDRIGKTDRGVLKVALMIAALDGEVTDDEYSAFQALAAKCRGATPENTRLLLDEAMRAAGYLQMLAKRASDEVLVAAFENEATAALPEGFACFSVEEVRHAFVTWIVMAASDGDYSARERLCVEALKRQFAERRISRVMEDEERRKMFTPAFVVTGDARFDEDGPVADDFIARVERVLSAYDDEAAVKACLAELVTKG